MPTKYRRPIGFAASLTVLLFLHSLPVSGETGRAPVGEESSLAWQDKAVDNARILSQVKWSPVAGSMPMRGGYFEAGSEYTGVPYSSVKAEGRYIGFDIFLKTFLAAVENPHSVLYTESLLGEVSNAECYYGAVCSSYTSYALQCGFWYVSRLHTPPHRKGVTLTDTQTAQSAHPGDIIFTPPKPTPGSGSHIEMVTGFTRGDEGQVTHVRVEESRPLTTKSTNRDASDFDAHLAARGRALYRITDLDAWREDNKAESFLFPNYEEDSTTPVINRVLLLDRGDWVAYGKGQAVKFNVMDRDSQGVKALVIKRGESIVEEISRPGRKVIERMFSSCGDYTAHCVMDDGSLSQVCEFSVCDLNFRLPSGKVASGEPLELALTSENMNLILVHVMSETNGYARYNVFLSAEDRKNGKVVIPGDLLQDKGKTQLWLIGENQYGRLKKRQDILVTD